MRENGFRAIGGLAQRLTSGIAAHRGKGGRGASIARLRAEWSAIVGPELARVSRPEALLGARLAGRRQVLVAALGAAVVGRDLRAQDLSRDKLLGALPDDHVLGKADAPNILIDYASFTCPHCASFYIAVMPTLRQAW